MVWYGMVWYFMVLYGIVWYGFVLDISKLAVGSEAPVAVAAKPPAPKYPDGPVIIQVGF